MVRPRRCALERADQTADLKRRAALLAQEEALVLEAAPIAPIYFQHDVYYVHPAVKVGAHAEDTSDYRYVGCTVSFSRSSRRRWLPVARNESAASASAQVSRQPAERPADLDPATAIFRRIYIIGAPARA